MKHINFLEQRSWGVTYNYLSIIIVLLFFICILGTVSFVQGKQERSLDIQIAALQAQINSLDARQGSDQERGGKTEGELSETMRDPLSFRVSWSELIHRVTQLSSATIHLESITGSALAERSLLLKGNSISLKSITQYKQNLEREVIFEKVLLLSTVEDAKKSSRHQFEIKCILK